MSEQALISTARGDIVILRPSDSYLQFPRIGGIVILRPSGSHLRLPPHGGRAMILEILAQRFSICKVRALPTEALTHDFVFFARTDQEFSLVCPENLLPHDVLAHQQGFRGLRIQGSLDFALVGVLAQLTVILAQSGISVFAISTYDTDYLFLREESLPLALSALRQAGYGMIFPGNAYTVEDFFQQDFPDPASNTNLN